MANVTDDDIERILKVKNVDLGLFVLAMHSLMERAMKEKFGSDDGFGVLIWDYLNDYKQTYGRPSYNGGYYLSGDRWNKFQTLKDLVDNHHLSNEVRHQFAQLTEEEAQSTVACFLAFAEAEGWKYLQTIRKLEAEVENWKRHGDYQSQELKNAIEEIRKLKAENSNLAQKANELKDLQNQLDVLTAKESLLQKELSESKARLSKKDEKLDKARQDAYEQSKKFREEKNAIQEKLKEYEATQRYMEYLERVSFYTKTRHDYERSIITLSSEQAEVLEQMNMRKDYLVKGAAGTGKSLVLIKTLEKAVNELGSELGLEEKAGSFRLLTYAKSLVKFNQYVTKLLGAQVPDDAITTADSFVFNAYKKFYPGNSIYYKYSEAPEGVFENSYCSDIDLYNEASGFIWANCITKEQYVDQVCSREGMKFPLKKAERAKLWEALETVEKKLERQKAWPRTFAARKILEKLAAGGPEVEKLMVEYSFVDEAQDLPPVMLAVIKKATKRAVFLAGDSDQSIYTKGFNWNRSGVDIKGRTKILHTNFRNTLQINEYAEKYRNTFKTKDVTTKPSAFRPGPPVEHVVADDSDDAMKQIVEQVKLLMNALNYSEENICIIANGVKKLDKIKGILDSKLGVEANIIDNNFNFETTPGIRLCTMQNCKGLDFPVVLFLADHRLYGADSGSVYDQETFMTQQFNMVYVALTRAMEMLFVYTVKGSTYEPFTRLE